MWPCRLLARRGTFRAREFDDEEGGVGKNARGLEPASSCVKVLAQPGMHLVVIAFTLMFSNQVIAESVLSWLLDRGRRGQCRSRRPKTSYRETCSIR